MATFIKLRLTYDNAVDVCWVNADRIVSIRPPVEGQDWFKHILEPGQVAPKAVVSADYVTFKTVETPEQILALIAAQSPAAKGSDQ